ncbi:hypothetical protein PP713_13860 [Mycobacterium sp. CSUR Q5927]|nr:hypothetical protein [Mycobacterium sp. CSUR Q5927]
MNDLHDVTVMPDRNPLFGTTFQARCEYNGCGYRGPFVIAKSRAKEIAVEHTRRMAGLGVLA